MKSTCFRIPICTLLALFVFVIFISAVNGESSAKYSIVETNDGKVRGVRKTTLIKNIDYYSFKGIPFTKSPTGELRFKAPEPIESWSPNVLDAFEHGPICIQQVIPGLTDDLLQSEDCLFLNIYVPADVKPDEKLAVIIHIHGGGYAVGSGDAFGLGPDFLIEQRVIVATLNYRLGVLGFMSFGTAEYSGNMGLKDQQLALKWIHSNIEHFSGDNNRITINGNSAGGSSVHFQMFSSESRKYFRNAIPMSGVVDNYWAMGRGNDHLDFARKIAEDLNQPQQSLDELIALLKSAPAEKIGRYDNMDCLSRRTLDIDMNPVIERKDAIRPFIVDEPNYEQFDTNVDAMFTLTETEFLTFYTPAAKEIFDLEGLDRNFSLTLPFREAEVDFNSKFYKRYIAKKIREFYFKDAAINKKTLKQYLDLLSDVNFAYGIDKAARQHAVKSNSKSYYLRFSVDSKLNIMKTALGGGEDFAGASHVDDLCYVFRCELANEIYDDILKNQNDAESKIILKTIDRMTKVFANFAKYGKPVHNGEPMSEFLPVQNDKVHFVDVTNDGLKPSVNPNHEANKLWADLEQLFQTMDNSAFQSRVEL